ncbi:hypothetical protein [Azospirillum sp. ST 5-10]|uniref:hypothetical protein n=1 Tax=unclassified Azospirillum TaxID=2630922 RepID=UPI003F4A537D
MLPTRSPYTPALLAEFDRLTEADDGDDSPVPEQVGRKLGDARAAICIVPRRTVGDSASLLRGVLLWGGREMSATDVPQIERAAAFLEAVVAGDARLSCLEALERLASTDAGGTS